jgi:hypothetical protein
VHVVKASVSATQLARANGPIQIAFDRYLLPSTVVRQSVVLREGDRPLAPTITYDPITRVITLGNPDPNGQNWLVPDQFYTITFPIPRGNEDNGLRAIDRATLDPATPVLGFKAIAPPANEPVVRRTMRFCNEVLPILQDRCGSSSCHGGVQGGSAPAAGLVLDSWYGIQNTAIGRVSNASNTGGRASPAAPGPIFGVDMPIIDPGNPGNSWLLYKIVMATPPAQPTDPPPRVTCAPPPVPAPRPFLDPPDLGVELKPADVGEQARLRDFVLGREMPYPPAFEALSVDWMRRLSAWIAQGAQVADCSKCE